MAGRTTFELSSAASNMAASQLFYFLLVPLIVLWLIYFKLSRRNLNKHAENIPGPPGLPIVGNLLDLMGSSHSKFSRFLSPSLFNMFFFSLSCAIFIHLPLRQPVGCASFCIACHHKSVAALSCAFASIFALCVCVFFFSIVLNRFLSGRCVLVRAAEKARSAR